MQLYKTTKLQTLFWEIKNRCVYILFSFSFTFAIAYQNCKSLLYLFVLSSTHTDKELQHTPSLEILPLLINLVHNNEGIASLEQQEIYLQSNNKNIGCILPEVSSVTLKKYALFTQYDISDLNNFSKSLKSIDISSIHFIFTDVEEAFSTILLVCFLFSSISILPILVYESFSFFSPSLYFHESRKWGFRLFTTIVAWCVFMYNVQTFFIPKLAEFLLKFQVSNLGFNLLAETKINSYCSWASSIFLVTNFIFFFATWLFFLVINKQLKIEYFTTRRKISVIIALLVSALIAPPEVIQIFLALIFFFCFEIFIYFFFVYKHFGAKLNRKKAYLN